MKRYIIVILVIYLIFLVSCENCERRVRFTNIYSFNIETSEIMKHCSIFFEGEPDGWSDYNKYYYSPDRTHFINGNRGGGNHIDFCNLQSGVAINTILIEDENLYSMTLNFSNSGEEITFAENTIYIASTYGDNLIEICDGKYPVFNPAEEKIAFVDIQGYLSIYDLSTNQITQLTYEDGIKFPVYHPNSDKIYFSSNNGIHVILIEDTLSINISNGDPSNCSTKFSISDSGEQKVFSSNNFIYAINNQDNIIDLETSGKYPHISHDGSKIVYFKSATDSIYIMNFDGTEKTNLCYTPIEADNACFSVDDQRVFFINRKWGMTDAYCDE